MRYFLSILLLAGIGVASIAQATVTNVISQGHWANVSFAIEDGCVKANGSFAVTETSLRNKNVETAPDIMNFIFLHTYNWCTGQTRYGYAGGNINVTSLSFEDPMQSAHLIGTFEMFFWEGDLENPQSYSFETVSLQVNWTGEGQAFNSRERITHTFPLLGRISWSSHGAWRAANTQVTMTSASLSLNSDMNGEWGGRLGDSTTHELMVYRPK